MTAATVAAVSRGLVSGFPNGFPQIRLGLRSSGSVHVDITVKAEIELLENRNQGFDVIVGRLSRSRQRKVALEEDFLFGYERNHQAVRVRYRRDVVHLNGARSVRVDFLFGNGFDLCFLGILRESVIQQRSWSVERLLEKLLIVVLRDDGSAVGHQRRKAASVIGMRMRVHVVTDRLVGDELFGFGDVSEATRLGLSGF